MVLRKCLVFLSQEVDNAQKELVSGFKATLQDRLVGVRLKLI